MTEQFICKQLMPPHIEDLIAHAATRKYDQKNIYCLKNYYYYRIPTGQRYYENEWNAERSPLQTTDLERDSFSLSLHQLPYLCKQWIT